MALLTLSKLSKVGPLVYFKWTDTEQHRLSHRQVWPSGLALHSFLTLRVAPAVTCIHIKDKNIINSQQSEF
jgi:hypothetical protein